MLLGLEIRDMLIIDRMALAFGPGLNVLTGETGAGKSILLDALGFVLGWRGRADLVRAGASQGEVTAVFSLPPGHGAHAALQAAGLPGGEELILRRINSRDGRKTAYVNDRRASGEVLRALSQTLVELHGQQDDRGLLDPRQHRVLLDEFGTGAGAIAGYGTARTAVRTAWRARAAGRSALEKARSALAKMAAEQDYLAHAVAELDALAPTPGEEAELDAKRRLMQAGARIGEDISHAFQALGSPGAEAQIADALRWLEGATAETEGRLDAPLAALSRALDELGEAQQGIETCLADLSFDPLELEATEERLFAIRALARKHDVLADDLAGFADDLRARLAALESGEARIGTLETEARAAEAAYQEASATLHAARLKAARRLDRAMAAELAPLKMERAIFTTAIIPAPAGPEGTDEVGFRVATNPGAPAGALDKIASGGELSRFLLALKVCLTAGAPGLTMIFDEIDRGVGGATADAVGRRLAALANGGAQGRAQVLVVTHSPQVAALGAHHFRVEKSVKNGITLSRVALLDAAQRVDEIGRMLSGDSLTPEARAAARALLGS